MSEGKAALVALGIAVGILTVIGALLVLCGGLGGFLCLIGTWPFVLWGGWLVAMRIFSGTRTIH